MRPIRIVTATALFDGHDASINLFRRLLIKRGAEVVHLGHSRSVREVVQTAVEEDADALLVSSYQGGHNEYYRYTLDLLREQDARGVLLFGGGGGVILPSEIKGLEDYGVERLYHADEGKRLGLNGVVDDILARIGRKRRPTASLVMPPASPLQKGALARGITVLEDAAADPAAAERLRAAFRPCRGVVVGITGTGGSGKSSLTDELIHRFLKVSPDITIAVLAVDPTKSTTGGALLGDRIRMNSIYHDRVYMRSLATRNSDSEVSAAAADAVRLLKSAGFHLILVETAGIGQRDHAVKALSDCTLYVMTGEFGAPSQLEKIDMLDLADFVALNKCCKPGAEDAFREITLHHVRSRGLSVPAPGPGALFKMNLPLFATEANAFNHPGVNALFRALLSAVRAKGAAFSVDPAAEALLLCDGHKDFSGCVQTAGNALSDIAATVRRYRAHALRESARAEECYVLRRAIDSLPKDSPAVTEVRVASEKAWEALSPETRLLIENWDKVRASYTADTIAYRISSRDVQLPTFHLTLSGLRLSKVALPAFRAWGDLVRFLYFENLPGRFPFTAGVFPFRSTFEDPKRQFAGEGTPEKTNHRLHFLCKNDSSRRLSIAFDPITLYGGNPESRPDIFGKIGESGVSVSTLDDMKRLFRGFDLADPMTSVSMTINGPAPVLLALYFMTAVDQAAEKKGAPLTGDETLDLFRRLRGTVQADILKEDQSQNTCIFSIDFALRMIGDVQRYFAAHRIRKFYSLSISGYHIAEAGANPVTQLAFTLANGFHYVEYFLSLGLCIDDFATNLSFFFSNGLDPEYTVLGRVARRIWAVVLRDRYGAGEKCQKLKYHIQTSGRSLHAHEIDLNDIRTTLQALIAFNDNCNSLHTNACDEAITTPTEESVRRAMAIQLIVSREFGLSGNENPMQGAFVFEELTGLVEEAVLAEFDRIAARGGVLGAMEKQYQRGRIQEESLYYEERKQSGALPIVGINTFVRSENAAVYDRMEVRRAAPDEKESQLEVLRAFDAAHAEASVAALKRLRIVVISGGNVFEELLNTVRVASLGKIVAVLLELGGQYRRNL
ncbi:MAG: methylmalonyl-CoA mutase family protein [Fibrobacterota bacterium]